MWPLPAVVKEMERPGPRPLMLGKSLDYPASPIPLVEVLWTDLRLEACSFQGYRPGKIIKWPTNPHKCSQFQFPWNYDPNFSPLNKTTNNCWMLATFANLFWGGMGIHTERGGTYMEQVRKRKQSWFCAYHVWKPWEMGPGFYWQVSVLADHATVLRTQHCLPGLVAMGMLLEEGEPDIRNWSV